MKIESFKISGHTYTITVEPTGHLSASRRRLYRWRVARNGKQVSWQPAQRPVLFWTAMDAARAHVARIARLGT